MKRLPLTILSSLLCGAATLAQDDRALIEQTAQDQAAARPTAPPPPPAPVAQDESLNAQELAARTELTLVRVRLELVLARKALHVSDYRAAADRALAVQALLKELPAALDASEHELQAEGILAKAAKAGVDVETLRRQAAGDATPLPGFDDYLDRQAQAAERIGRRYSGADRAEVSTAAGAADLRRQALQRQTPTDHGYRPAREIFDTPSILQQDEQRLYYEAALRKLYQTDEARRTVEAHEARVAPDGDVAYPDDWAQKSAAREKYRGGRVAKSDSWVDGSGREWFVALYDTRDLIYEPPDFRLPFSMFAGENLRDALDREALRQRSQIFNGYAEDLAAGIPLLRYFGGVDDFEYRGPKYNLQKQQEIIGLINAFTQQVTEAKVIPLGP
jgi:hypothetical protein